MPYDHSTKTGNEGDVVKHTVLYNCVLKLLSDLPPQERFTYAESHCGRPSYVLPEGGEWLNGIRLLSTKTNALLEANPKIHGFREAMLSRNLKVGQQYFGSSNIVFRTLRVQERELQFNLFETEHHAFDDLLRYYQPWPNVLLHRSDGYAGLSGLASASLVLIDPPRLDANEVRQCIHGLIDSNIPYICWTPRNSSSNGNRVESQTSVNFGQIDEIGHHFNMRWADPSGAAQHTFGCRLTVSDNLESITDGVLKELANVMANDGWRRQ